MLTASEELRNECKGTEKKRKSIERRLTGRNRVGHRIQSDVRGRDASSRVTQRNALFYVNHGYQKSSRIAKFAYGRSASESGDAS